jgi:hypothetical protein
MRKYRETCQRRKHNGKANLQAAFATEQPKHTRENRDEYIKRDFQIQRPSDRQTKKYFGGKMTLRECQQAKCASSDRRRSNHKDETNQGNPIGGVYPQESSLEVVREWRSFRIEKKLGNKFSEEEIPG